MKAPIVRIRGTVYRGKQGFTVTRSAGAFPKSRVFTETHESALHIQGKLRRGELVKLEDFTYPHPYPIERLLHRAGGRDDAAERASFALKVRAAEGNL